MANALDRIKRRLFGKARTPASAKKGAKKAAADPHARRWVEVEFLTTTPPPPGWDAGIVEVNEAIAYLTRVAQEVAGTGYRMRLEAAEWEPFDLRLRLRTLRLETNDEYAARLEKHDRAAQRKERLLAKARAERDREERELYFTLKAKYEGSDGE